MKNLKYFLLMLAFVSQACSEGSESSTIDQTAPSIADAYRDQLLDIHIIDWTAPDAYVDPCENSNSSQENFCDCNPQCCQRQLWYCPPSGFGVHAAEITMNICDDNLIVCDRTIDFTCPPNEILSRGECNSIL